MVIGGQKTADPLPDIIQKTAVRLLIRPRVDPAELKTEQVQKLRSLYEAARKVGRELLVEIIAGKNGSLKVDTVSRVLAITSSRPPPRPR